MYKQITSGPQWDHIISWAERVSKPIADNNGWPMCPYARKAIVNNSIKVWTADDYSDLCYLAKTFEMRPWAIDVVILPTADSIDQFAEDINWNFEQQGIIALADDPSRPGDIAGHNPSNGEYPVLILQDRDDLLHKRAGLKSTNYYSTWPEWYRDYVLNSI